MSAFIDQERERFAVDLICRTLGVSPSAYYQRATGKRLARALEDERLLEGIREVHAANYYAYGSRRMWKALLRSGESVGRGRVERLMRANGIQGAKRRGKARRTTTPDPGAWRRPDLVQRDFSAGQPDELWLADFTYLRCHEGIVFFSLVIDAYSRMIVGWQFAGHIRTDLVLDALRMALTTRRHGADVRLVHHSDRGSQYTSTAIKQPGRILPRTGTWESGSPLPRTQSLETGSPSNPAWLSLHAKHLASSAACRGYPIGGCEMMVIVSVPTRLRLSVTVTVTWCVPAVSVAPFSVEPVPRTPSMSLAQT